MPADWLQRKKETGELEINNEALTSIVKPQLEAVKKDVDSSIDAKLKPVLTYIEAQTKKEQEAEAQRAAAARKKQQEESEIDETDYITDPKGAIDKRIAPLERTIMAQNAIIMRKETLEKMDYYSSDPEFKNKVDALIDAQPLSSRANAAVIMNAYKSVFFDNRKEIEEGKIKSQASLLSNAGGGTGGHSGSSRSNGQGDDDIMSQEEKNYAAKLGISEKDWAAQKKELEYV